MLEGVLDHVENFYVSSSNLTLYPTIFTGETFKAYLGALNVSNTLDVKALTVTAQLQTPSARLPLPSTLDA